MGAESVHFSGGSGLDIVISGVALAAGAPVAAIQIQTNGTTFPDVACAMVVRMTSGRLMTLLGNTPVAESILAGGTHIAVHNSGIVRRIAEDILQSPYKGAGLALFLQGKVMELLVEGVSSPTPVSTGERIALSVRDTLLSNPQHPPPVPELARMHGVTQRKLGEYFHAQFGKTIPTWLSDWRMVRARDLLMGGELSVKDVAASVGFTQVTAFTRTFTNHFGFPPSRIRLDARNTKLSVSEGQP